MTAPATENDVDERISEENVRVVRAGHGANCSSVGSVIDTLFLGAVVGSALVAAVAAALARDAATAAKSDAEDDGSRDSDDASQNDDAARGA